MKQLDSLASLAEKVTNAWKGICDARQKPHTDLPVEQIVAVASQASSLSDLTAEELAQLWDRLEEARSTLWTLRFYGGETWETFLSATWPGHVFHGQKLVMTLLSGDNVDRARQCLRAAEKLGMLKRQTYRPTTEQQFFGLNSHFGKAVLQPKKTGFDEVAYEWEVLRCTWP